MASQQQQVNSLSSSWEIELEQQTDSNSDETGNVTIHEDFLLSQMGRNRDMDGELRKSQKTTPFIGEEFTESGLDSMIMQAEALERQAEEGEWRADAVTKQLLQEIDDSLPAGEIKVQVDSSDVATNIENTLGELDPEHSEYLSEVMSIYRVPRNLREGSEQYYTPRVVSIGPFHYGNKKYKAMEIIKLKSLRILIKESSQRLAFYVDKFKDYLDTARYHYSEKFAGELESNDNFLKMMLVDGAFIIKFMISYGVSNTHVIYDEADREGRIFLSPQDVSDIKHDMCLLENQLPFEFLKNLNSMLFDNQKSPSSKITWRKDLTSLAWEIWPQAQPPSEYIHLIRREPRHFLDLLRQSKLPARIYAHETSKGKQLKHRSIKSAKKLHEAGLKVKGVNRIYGREWATFDGAGKLKISPLEIDDTSLGLYKNIMALEQCRYPNAQHVTDYLILMEMLSRDGSEDLLMKNGVIVNKLTTEGATAAQMLKELCKNITYSSHPFGMGTLCKDVTDYCDSPARRFRAFLSGRTWQIGATIILILTLIQTACSVLALFSITFGRST